MSDPLDHAVDASVDAHTPDAVPPLETVLARKKARDRRRGGAALAATALAVAGVASVPSALTGNGSGGTSPGQVAQDGPTTVLGGDLPCEAPRGFIYGLAKSTGGAPTPEEAAERFGARPGAEPGYAGQTWTRAGSNPSGELQMQGQTARLGVFQGSDGTWLVVSGSACPHVTTQPMHRTYTVQPARRAPANARLDEQRDACFALPGVKAVGQGESAPVTYRVKVLAGQSEPFERCISAVLGLYVPEIRANAGPAQEWTGAQVCAVVADEECRRLTAEQAQALDAVLASAEPEPEGAVYCEATSTVYRVSFQHPSLRPVPVEVPYRCGPVQRGDERLVLGQAGLDAVKAAFEAGTPADVPITGRKPERLTAEQQAFVDECVGAENALPAPGYVGKKESELGNSTPPGFPPRLVGRDGRCLDREDDRRDDRINLIVEDDEIIWAGRF